MIRKLFAKSSQKKAVPNNNKPLAQPGFTINDTQCISSSDLETQFYRSLYPDGNDKPVTVPQKLVLSFVASELEKPEIRAKAIPRLPSVVPKLLRSLRDPDSSAKDYVKIVDKDPVMSATVLKLANSVYFNPINARINSIERAIVKLGIDGLRSVLSAAVMQPIIQKESPYFVHTGLLIWQHSLACAVACELLGRRYKVEPFKAYILGLVHDIGKVTLFSELCRQFKLNGETQDPGYEAFTPLSQSMAAKLSAWIARDWQLPPEICTALQETTNISPDNTVSPYTQLLFQANIACEAYICLRPDNPQLASKLLQELKLPENFFKILDQLSTEV